ncbi:MULTISPECIES: hypothetical protein [unclassified Beijerinckia]|uniref:hypothetical protein n=1 Tax=unclassified Beijerinckia TaxID=2638183 RepID=UPI00089D163F|nr:MULTISPECIES: hypothetical protein [unclassified Beijerinckia]MDH7796430.1 hypothetical protein [Beijerinckia sp. GAS462]SEC44749.1 hypothetical protein SAMN05443249_2712 [Beijerinckia sp. 28-YEA-48]
MYKTCRLSLIRAVMDAVSGLQNPTGNPLEYIDWDGHTDFQKLPASDLIGISGFGMTENGGLYDIVFGISVSTINDPNMFRTTDFVDVLLKRLKGGMQFDLLDANADKIGVATMVEGTSAMPVVRAEVRNVFTVSGTAVTGDLPD